MKSIIIHISNDYPDPLQPDKTRAVINLVEGTPEYRHVVYSLNRVTGWKGISALPFGEDRTAIAYGALPKGLFWEARLRDVADWIIADLKEKNIRPDLVEAHKFTVEGLIGQEVAKEFACPLVCDIQGNTDVKILRMKPGLRKRYAEIAGISALVFPYAPWMIKPFADLAGLPSSRCVCLPVIPNFDHLSQAPVIKQSKLATVFHLDSWKRKNLPGIVDALKLLSKRRPDIVLDVYGRGSAKTMLELQHFISASGIGDRIRLKGQALNNSLPTLFKNYSAFVMPTLFETYGLVFAEALFSGLPVLFSRERGIDGYLDPRAVGYACDPTDVNDIAAGIDHILNHEAELKKSIATMQAAGGFDFMRREGILSIYRNGLNAVLSRKAA